MYCAKCGNQLTEGAKFCDACGEGILQKKEETPQNPQNFQSPRDINKPAKTHKGLIIVISAIAAVLLMGFILYSNAWRILPDKTYYSYLELKNKPITFNKAFKEITAVSEIKPFSKDIELSIDGISGLESMQSKLDDFTVQTQIDYSKDKLTSYINFKYMNNILLDALVYEDKDILGLGLPLLYDSNFIVSKNEIMKTVSNLTGNDMPEQGEKVKSGKELIAELDSDTKLLDKAFNKYSKLVLDNIPAGSVEVTGSGDAISIYTWNTGRSKPVKEIENYRQVVIKLSQKDLNKIADEVLAELKNDDVLLERVYYYTDNYNLNRYGYGMGEGDQTDKADVIADWKDSIEAARDNLSNSVDEEDDSNIVTMTVIADNKNNIISREFSTPEGTLTYAQYMDDSHQAIKEINVSNGRLGMGNQIANLYVYNGESGKGVNASTSENGKVELSYVRSDRGTNNSGMGYGDYKARLQTQNDEYVVTVSTEKAESNKSADLLKVRVQQNSNEIVSCNISIKDLKNKSKLKFSKDGSIDLARTDESELQDIFSEIQNNFSNVGNDLGSLMYDIN